MKAPEYFELLKHNREWVKRRLQENPDYFTNLAESQNPQYLFIGCSDSRAPLTLITKVQPGDVFVHRNIANIVNISDMNVQSVIEYAVQYLKVKDIIVVGHYRCGGVKAAIDGIDEGLIENWVSSIKDLYFHHHAELKLIPNQQEMLDRLSELNVLKQTENIAKTPAMQRAFKQKPYPRIHGWIFDIYTGLIKEMVLPIEKWKIFEMIPMDY